MIQSIENARTERDNTIAIRQNAQLQGAATWKRKYDELYKFQREQLARETANCIEISALRIALEEAQRDAEKWRKRCEEIQNTTI